LYNNFKINTARFINRDLTKIDDLIFRFLDLEIFFEEILKENSGLRNRVNKQSLQNNDFNRNDIDKEVFETM